MRSVGVPSAVARLGERERGRHEVVQEFEPAEPGRCQEVRRGPCHGGHRDCPEAAVDRVVRIQELFAAGLHSTRIKDLLPCMRDQDGGPSAVATPRPAADLAAERDRIDRMIADLVRSRETLDEVIRAARES
ncbi:MerR family transcriptional regulator [Streptomyces sp. NPDC048282]|uniref:MerR family transcriptional regulator n=1 Tax=Streptomyces sp. NPDC048282 TaxID=3365528 RepID=UPI0037190434